MTATSPLLWPDNLPRTKRPAIASFKTSGYDSYQHLKKQVKLLGGKNLIFTSNLPANKGGEPLFSRGRSTLVDPGVAIYFERSGVDLCMANDRWDTVDDNIRGVGLSLEAMRGQERWITHEMQEAMFTGFAALPETSTTGWWDVLGIDRNAGREDIDRAYRILLKQWHPDRGGDTEMFHRIQAAYWAATQEARLT
jgi:hypothetical protein